MTTEIVTSRWHGPVHEYHSPTAITSSSGEVVVACGNVENGKQCRMPKQSSIHSFIASPSCAWPVAKVEIYVQRSEGYVGKIHYATFAWQAENEGSWFSGWYKAHNDQANWRRVVGLDCKSGQQIGQFVGSACSGAYTEDILNGMEVRNQ